jgi:hypothetical protein
MSVHTIQFEGAQGGSLHTIEQVRTWCALLEAGGILYFPRTPVPIPAADLQFLLGQQQTGSRLHKNIAYKPDRDQLSGVDKKSATPADLEQLHSVMRRYSASVDSFLAGFLAPYQMRWRLDYASFRPLEEEGRDLPVRRRNDLLHTDAFPTRPTRGWRILRFFHNIHPTRTRDWVVGDPFAKVVHVFAPGKLVAGEAKFREQPDAVVVGINLVPAEAVARGDGMRMVVVVPAFAAAYQGDPPVVARVVARFKAALPHRCVAELTSQVACRPRVTRRNTPHSTSRRR